MRAEMWGGPLDGHKVNVPNESPILRYPIPGSLHDGVQIATYERCAWDLKRNHAVYEYMGQERS